MKLIGLHEMNGEFRQFVNVAAITFVYRSTGSRWNDGMQKWEEIPTTRIRVQGRRGDDDLESWETVEAFVLRANAAGGGIDK